MFDPRSSQDMSQIQTTAYQYQWRSIFESYYMTQVTERCNSNKKFAGLSLQTALYKWHEYEGTENPSLVKNMFLA